MTRYEIGQHVKVEFRNDFHGTSATAIATITHIDTDFWTIKLPEATEKRIERKLCGLTDCRCNKIDSCVAVADKEIKLILR